MQVMFEDAWEHELRFPHHNTEVRPRHRQAGGTLLRYQLRCR